MPRRLSSSVKIFYPKYSKIEVLRIIQRALQILNEKLPLKLVILFGSYSKGNYTVASDIDLLVVYRGPEREDAYAVSRRTLGVPRLEPHVYSEEEYERMKTTVDRMTEEGILLYP